MNKQLVGIASGFILVIVMMIIVIVVGIYQMIKINSELNLSLLKQNKKARS